MVVVKVNSGEIDKHTLILDVEWASPGSSEPREDDNEDKEMHNFYGNDGDRRARKPKVLRGVCA